jgi:hypothetical protein
LSLSIEQIRACRANLARESVDVPELGGSITIRVLTQAEVGDMQKGVKSDQDPMAIYPRMLALACVNDDGSPLFVGEDVRVIRELPWPAVDALAKAIMKLNKIEQEKDAPKASA